MNELVIRKATRQGVKPLIGLYSESGRGKTYSSLLLARGFVGPSGKIVMIDTESGRGSLYADVIPGGYDVLELREPFHPSRYMDALRVAEEHADIVVIDSMTHEWESAGGVQDLALQGSQERAARFKREWDGVVQFGDWKAPKMEHTKMMARFLQSPKPIVCCIRAKHKSHQVTGTKEMADAGIIEPRQIGRTVVVKDEFTSPIQEEGFIFEMTAHAEIMPDHSCRLTKCSHPSLKECFPNGPITIQTGEAIARWCAAPGASQPASKAPSGIAQLKTTLREVTERIHGWRKGMTADEWTARKPSLQSWLTDECGIDTLIDAMTAEQLGEAIAKAEGKLREAA